MNKENLKMYLLNNMEDTKIIVRDINRWHEGVLSELDFIEMYDFNMYMEGTSPAYQIYKMLSGNFNRNDKYFIFDEHDNLFSYDEEGIEHEIKLKLDKVIDVMIEYKDSIDIPDKVRELM